MTNGQEAGAAKPTLSKFLESSPPGRLVEVRELAVSKAHYTEMCLPDLQLHCEKCGGTRRFVSESSPAVIKPDSFTEDFVDYECSNCALEVKRIAIAARRSKSVVTEGEIFKFGEMPPFGPPTPARLLSLIGPDSELFLKGRRSETQGLGIGAFSYYRRVVNNQKNRILDEIIKVAKKVGASAEMAKALEDAKSTWQFTKSVDAIKDAIPESLRVSGHNPLVLLHDALSDGLHEQTDEHCLELAQSIRVVLAELAERMSQALKDDAELTTAVSKLLKKRA